MKCLLASLLCIVLTLISCVTYQCEKEGWDGTYDDCYDNFDLQYFPFYGEYEAWQTIYIDSIDAGSGFATIRFDPDGSFSLSLSIECVVDNEIDICANANPDTPYWLLELDGTFTFSNRLVENIQIVVCERRWRQHDGPYELTIINTNQMEFENITISNDFSITCSRESLTFNYFFPNGNLLQATFGDEF
jgi:hypothetical protein